jgi:uncharacterized delta-60 repeat protein
MIVCACGHPAPEGVQDASGNDDVAIDVTLDANRADGSDSVAAVCQHPGQLDPGFGVGGVAGPLFSPINPFAASGYASSLTFDPATSRVLIGGSVHFRDIGPFVVRFAVVALRIDGTLDPTFGVGGRAIVSVPGYSQCYLTGIALQSDGKLVGSGSCVVDDQGYFALIRFLSNGQVDPTFGDAGIVVEQATGPGGLEAIAIDNLDRIVVTGQSWDPDQLETSFATLRYLGNGTRDASFGAGGLAVEPFHNGADLVRDLALQADGRIVVTGDAGAFGSTKSFAVVRYNVDGTLDPTFGTNGVSSPFGVPSRPNDVTLDQAGRAVVSGVTNGQTGIARLDNGQLDLSFNGSGTVTYVNAGSPTVPARQDDSFYGAGAFQGASGAQVLLAHFTPSGALDLSFGGNGDGFARAHSTLPAAYASAVITQPDGRIVVAGTQVDTSAAPIEDFFVARFCP